jgi:phage terminase small subunit
MSRKKNTLREMAVVDSYFKNGMNQVQALIENGYGQQYARKCGWSYFNKPGIQALIERRVKKMENKVGVTYEWCLEQLKNFVMNFPDKMVPAIQELNKMLDHYSPEKHIHTHTVTGEIKQVIEEKEAIKKKYERSY